MANPMKKSRKLAWVVLVVLAVMSGALVGIQWARLCEFVLYEDMTPALEDGETHEIRVKAIRLFGPQSPPEGESPPEGTCRVRILVRRFDWTSCSPIVICFLDARGEVIGRHRNDGG